MLGLVGGLGPLDVLLMGVVQGVLEWLPVSSSGQTLAAGVLRGLGASEAYGLALFLHLGTGLAAATLYRGRLWRALRRPLSWDGVVLAVPTLVGAPVGLVVAELFAGLQASIAMVVVGLLLVATGLLLVYEPRGRRVRGLRLDDLVVLGLAQGVAVMPGLSRSGLATAVLLLRGVGVREAFDTVFYTSIPASLLAALYAAAREGAVAQPVVALGLLAAYLSSIAVIRFLLAVAERMRRRIGVLMVAYGLAMAVLSLPAP